MSWWEILLLGLGAALLLLALYDLFQRRHSILRIFPVVGHLRFLLERIGPELRQYVVASNNEERPFSREQRSWVYASAKNENNYFGFGTDKDLEASPGHVVITHSTEPLPTVAHSENTLPGAKVLGAHHGRRLALRPPSAVNISGMSFGSLSGAAITALNRGAALAGCWHNTGEGGLSPAHQSGGDLVFQVGTGYFSVRTPDGRFDLARLVDLCAENPVRAIEVKLSQGAKPGLGGVLPGAKVTPEIARIRGIEPGRDCISPASHSAFTGVDGCIEFLESLAAATGLPVGLKLAVGETSFLERLCARSVVLNAGPDFLTIDGGEGGTGAAPLAFTDHVALPLKIALARTYRILRESGLDEQVVLNASGKLGFPDAAAFAFALGADQVSVAREAMLSIGCIQAQRCHTGRCPTGVATQNPWLTRGLDPTDKSVRAASYIQTLRHELLLIAHACGVSHPALLGPERIELLDASYGSRRASEVFGYEPGWGLPSPERARELDGCMHPVARITS